MDPHLKLLARGLINERRPVNRELAYLRRQWHRPDGLGTGAFYRFHDLPGRFINNLIIVRPKFDPDPLGYLCGFFRHTRLLAKNNLPPR